MRGAHPRLLLGRQRQGIIPADAGSTHVPIDIVSQREDHPRRCGEHGAHAFETVPSVGSSPQMRGALT